MISIFCVDRTISKQIKHHRKQLKKVLFIGLMAFIVCLARTVQAQELYKNEKAPIHERIMDLLSRLTVEER